MSFQQGLSGLNASSKNLEVIGNNIANSATYGFKNSRAEFADVYANAMNGAGSNSVGIGSVYDRDGLAEVFDDWVISSEVGLRKPLPEIYELAAERLGLAPSDCVYVDDLPPNLKPARALGMATVLHRGDAAATLAEIGAYLR